MERGWGEEHQGLLLPGGSAVEPGSVGPEAGLSERVNGEGNVGPERRCLLGPQLVHWQRERLPSLAASLV